MSAAPSILIETAEMIGVMLSVVEGVKLISLGIRH